MIDPAEYGQLCEKQSELAATTGFATCADSLGKSQLLLQWIGYLTGSHLTGVADELLEGTQAAIAEAAVMSSFGLSRAATTALRSQVDMLLSWLFFKDHRVEWAAVQREGENFKLKSQAIKYLGDWYPGYSTKYALLKTAKRRSTEDPYKLLSVHIHSQTQPTIPIVGPLSSLIFSTAHVAEILALQLEMSEFLSDICAAAFYPEYVLFPAAIRKDISDRLSAEALRQFCDTSTLYSTKGESK